MNRTYLEFPQKPPVTTGGITPNLNVTGLVVAQHDPAGTEGNDQALAHIDILQFLNPMLVKLVKF